MRSMVRVSTGAAANMPAELLKIREQLNDPDFLDALVDAAERITEANKLTDEEGMRLAEANSIIAKANLAEEKLKSLNAAIGELEAREAAVARREKLHKQAQELLSAAG